jgi:hypothetical protein
MDNRVVAYGAAIKKLYANFQVVEPGFTDSYITFYRQWKKEDPFELKIGEKIYHCHSFIIPKPAK